jgi:hypothetical protein
MGIYTAKNYCIKLSPLVRELTWLEKLQFIKLSTLSRELKLGRILLSTLLRLIALM